MDNISLRYRMLRERERQRNRERESERGKRERERESGYYSINFAKKIPPIIYLISMKVITEITEI